jgi:crotonobetainyl-CoA:carnitine CoA-transferase CaiB-like acyl-CoA transferase
MSGLYGAIGALVALRARERTGAGQVVDLALYESVFRVLDEIAPAYQKFGQVRERMGADIGYVCPHSHYQTADGKWIALACTNDEMFARLADGMQMPGLASDAMYGRKDKRLAAREEVNRIVAAWVRSHKCEEVLALCERADVPAGLINSIADILANPQFKARRNIAMHPSRIGELAVPGVVPRLSATPGAINWLGPALGEHTGDVLREILGMSDRAIDDLRKEGVI